MLIVTSTPKTLSQILLQDQEVNSAIQAQDALRGGYGWTILNIGSGGLTVVVSYKKGQTDTTKNLDSVVHTLPTTYPDSAYTKGVTIPSGSFFNLGGYLSRDEIYLSSATTTEISVVKASIQIGTLPTPPTAPAPAAIIDLGLVYRDTATAPSYVYYTRALKSDGTVVWIDALGLETVPPVGLQPVNDDASKVLVNECRVSVVSGAGHTVGDRLQNAIVYNQRDATATNLWFNLTLGTQISAPLTASTEPCDSESLRKLEDIKTKLDSANISLTTAASLLSDIDENTDEIELKLEDIKTNLDAVNSSVAVGNASLASIDTKLTTMGSDLSAILTEVAAINTNTDQVESLLTDAITELSDTQTLLQTEFDETQALIATGNDTLNGILTQVTVAPLTVISGAAAIAGPMANGTSGSINGFVSLPDSFDTAAITGKLQSLAIISYESDESLVIGSMPNELVIKYPDGTKLPMTSAGTESFSIARRQDFEMAQNFIITAYGVARAKIIYTTI